jgi:hypothetical protein
MRFQFVAAVVCVTVVFGFLGFYATLVCIACSQLQKVKANLLDIRQKHDTSEQGSGAETDQEEEGQVQTFKEKFCDMQKQLNNCIRHHQEILQLVLLLLLIFTIFCS